MFKVLIIDDEKNVRDVITAILGKKCTKVEIVGEANSVETGKAAIKKMNPDLVLLDINLPDGTGFDILKAIEKPTFKLIFITAYEEYALKAFKFSAIDYILKPINSNELADAVNKVAENRNADSLMELSTLKSNYASKDKDTKKIILKTHDAIYAIAIKDIMHCEADTGYTTFFMNDGKSVMVSNTIKEYDELLSEYGFFRIHQSHLINLDYFAKFKKTDGGLAVLKNGTEIPVSSRKKDTFLEAIGNL